jgi:predicted esterase
MRKGLLFSLLVLLVALIGYPALQWQRGRIRSQIRAMHARLIAEGYHVTLSFDYPGASAAQDVNQRFLIPASSDGPIHIVLMNRAILGSVDVGVTREDGSSVFSATGRNFDRAEDLRLSPGKYRLTAALHGARFGALEIGVQQSITFMRDLDPRLYAKVDPPANGPFSWPYYLYVPPKLDAGPKLLVVPNNTGFCDDELEVHEEAAKNEILRASKMANAIGCPLLVPVFPRPATDANIYTHALDRDVLACGRRDIGRLDLQLAAMVQDVGARLRDRDIRVGPRILLFGFSASGMFVNRFTILHPDLVAAVASGSPGGWPIAPVAEYQGASLRYPIGIADIERLVGTETNMGELRRVPMYMFLGADDTNDSVVFRDGYEEEDERLVMARFGSTLPQRWKIAESLYRSAGLSAQFVLYPSVAHEVTPQMQADVVAFFRREMNVR